MQESAFAVAIGGKADTPFCIAYVRLWPPADIAAVVKMGGWWAGTLQMAAQPRSSRHVVAPSYSDTVAIARAYIKGAPERMVWASDWPHLTRGQSGHLGW